MVDLASRTSIRSLQADNCILTPICYQLGCRNYQSSLISVATSRNYPEVGSKFIWAVFEDFLYMFCTTMSQAQVIRTFPK